MARPKPIFRRCRLLLTERDDIMATNHPEQMKELYATMGELGKGIPQTMAAFSKLHTAACAEGALDTKTKELIALGIAIVIRCNGCISCHVSDALGAGATEDEILETVGVAILMGGGPSVVYGCEALEAVRQFKLEHARSNGH